MLFLNFSAPHLVQSITFLKNLQSQKKKPPNQYGSGAFVKCSSVCQLQELFVVHLLIRDILSVMEQGVIRDRCRSALRLFPALDMNRPERNIVLFCSLLQDRHVLGVERALAGVVQNVSFFIYMRMPCAFPELRPACVPVKRQIPQLNPIVRLVTHCKSLIFEELRIRKKRFLLSRGQNAQS